MNHNNQQPGSADPTARCCTNPQCAGCTTYGAPSPQIAGDLPPMIRMPANAVTLGPPITAVYDPNPPAREWSLTVPSEPGPYRIRMKDGKPEWERLDMLDSLDLTTEPPQAVTDALEGLHAAGLGLPPERDDAEGGPTDRLVAMLHAQRQRLLEENARLRDAIAASRRAAGGDGCKFCLGAKGGVPGNANRIGGEVVCDYCTSLLLKIRDTERAQPTGSVFAPASLPDVAMPDDIEQRTEKIRQAHANPVGRSRTHLIRDAAHLLAHIALLKGSSAEGSAQVADECATCNSSGIVGFPPDQYESCPDCTPAAVVRAPGDQQ